MHSHGVTDWKSGVHGLYPLSEGIPVAHPRTLSSLVLSADDRADLDRLARSYAAPARGGARAQVQTTYADGATCPVIARTLGIPLPAAMRGVKKGSAQGPRRCGGLVARGALPTHDARSAGG